MKSLEQKSGEGEGERTHTSMSALQSVDPVSRHDAELLKITFNLCKKINDCGLLFFLIFFFLEFSVHYSWGD